MKEIRVYIEGGGSGRGRQNLSKGFKAFIASALGAEESKTVSVIPCGDGARTYRKFRDAVTDHPDALNLLLVDSEEPVSVSARDHMAQRGWDVSGIVANQCHLMVQMTEAWFLADKERLATYFGNGFNANALPGAQDMESVDTNQIKDGLKNATRRTRKRRYDKTRDAPEILKVIRPERVRAAARRCNDLFETLESVIGDSA